MLAALNTVVEPETGRGLVDAGLVKGLVVERGRAGFVIEVSADKARAYAPVRDQAEAVLKPLGGIERVHVVLTAEQPAARPRGASLSKAAVEQGRPKAPVATSKAWRYTACAFVSLAYSVRPSGLQAKPLPTVTPWTTGAAPCPSMRYSAASGRRASLRVPTHQRPAASGLPSL